MKSLVELFVVFFLLLLMTGCGASKKPSLLVRSMEVNKIIEGGTVLPDHKYFFAGPEDKPDVIIGIHQNYEFQQSVHWRAVDLTEEQLQSWNRIIDNRYRIKLPYRGAYIMTPDGQQAGIWYSKYDFTVIKYPAPNQIVIYRPDPTPYQRQMEQSPWGDRF